MITEGAIPRRSVESDPIRGLMRQITRIQARVATLEAGARPLGHKHKGEDVTGTVASATSAVRANGSSTAFNNNVQGTTTYAVWVGNAANNPFGRNTSSIRYKENVRAFQGDPEAVLALQPVVYDRRDVLDEPIDPDTGERLIGPPNLIRATRGEYGLIAEQVAEHVPEIIQWYEGEIDSIRYDLLSVALLDVVKSQAARISALEDAVAALVPDFTPPTYEHNSRYPAPAAPQDPPAPLPYEIGPFVPHSWPEPEPAPEPEPQPEPEPEPAPEPEPEPDVEPEPEPDVELAPEPEPEADPEPTEGDAE